MTSDDKCCPPPKEVQDFLFKQASISQVCDEFVGTSANPSLIAVDGKRGILYIGHGKKLIVFKPGSDTTPEWKLELDLPDGVCRMALSCDHSFLAVAFNNPSALIYDASSIHKHKLDILHEIRLSSSGGVVLVTDLKWNPAIPEILCSITSDHTIGCFQVNRDKRTGVQIIGMEKPQGIEALCVSWSPKGKQLVVGCKNGDIIQLKPELKPARHLTAPNPYEGVIISILWVSNYQFCACYFHPDEQRISMMLVDAPKGVTAPKYINYEDVTFGTGSMEGLTYYLEHISEWGIIIAASTHSCEVAVLGTDDNGATWSQYQLMDDSTAQLPLNRKTKTENYPVGIAIDKSSTQKLPWGAENFLPNPVPVLRILVTSGQLCCFHMVNLKANAPSICTPPTEFITAPQLPRPSLGPSEISFNLHAGITSTPRSKPVPAENSKPKPSVNMFGDSPNPSFTLPPSYNKTIPSQPEIKTNVLFGEGDGKMGNFLPQHNKPVTQPAIIPQTTQQIKQTPPQSTPQLGIPQSTSQQLGIQQSNQQQSGVQLNTKPGEFSLKSDNRTELKIPSVSAQAETRLVKESAREPPPQYSQEESNSTVKEAPAYDDGLCLRAYYEEQARFEKELKSRLDLPNWNCGTEEERQLLVKRTNEIDEFLKELRETTNSLVSEIAYLKALLLQSFAWIEESKSKNSSNADIGGRNRADSKLADLQRFYYYTQSQLIQATKALDLEWADHNNREMSRMKIPSLEKIYQSLIRYSQIITQEKKNLEDLAKKWRSIGRENNAVSSLNQSMSSMNLSSTLSSNDAAIDQRCKHIAKSTKNFSREKQIKLRDLLSESAPKIVRAVRPTAVQDRLEATLSSLAALKNTEPTNKARQNKNIVEQQRVDATRSPLADAAKSTGQNSLSSLDNLVSGIGANASGVSPLGKSTSSTAPFASFGAKPTEAAPFPSFGAKATETAPFASFGAKAPETAPFASFASKATEAAPFPSFGAKTTEAAPFASFATKVTEAAPFPSFGAKATEAAPFASFAAKVTEAAPFPSFGAKATETTPFPSFGAKTTEASQVKPKENAKTPLIQTNAAAAATTSKPFGTLDSVNFGASNQKPVESSKANDVTTHVLNMFTSAPQFNLAPPLATTTASPPAPKPVTFSFSSSTSNNFVPQSVPKLDNSGFKFSLNPAGQQNLTAQDSLDMSALSFGNRSDTAKTTIAASQSTNTSSSMFGKSTGTAVDVSSANKPADGSLSATLTTQTTTPSTVAPTTTASSANTAAASPSIFNSSSLFGALSSAAAPSSTFSFSTAAAQAPKSATPALMSPTIAFDSLSNTSSTLPNLSSLTSSLGTGVPGSTITPTFGKSTAPPVVSIFNTTPASGTTTPVTSSIFGKSGDSAAVSSTSTTPVTGGATSTATTTTATSSSIFANTTAATTTTSIFGGQTTVSSSSTENSFFKTPASTSATVSPASSGAATTATAPIFGGTATATTTGSVFGAASPTVFGGASSTTPIVAAAATQSSNIFGTSTTTPSSSIFGTSATSSTGTSVFGTTSTASTSTSVFGTNTTPNTATSVFGTSSTPSSSASVFGANTTPSIFGASSTTKSTGGSIFGGGGAAPAFGTGSAFGATTTTSSSVFGGGAAGTGGSLFGSSSTFGTNATPTASVFGGGAAATTTAASIFGSPAATTTSNSLFGAQPAQQPAAGIFGASSLAGSTGGSVFGGAPSMGSGVSMFGGATASPAFGQPSGFGEKPVFGSPSAGFGGFGNAAFGNAASPGFGSSPGIGSNPASAQTSPSKVFGSNTFENLGAQAGGDISFGSLAQKSPEQNKPAFGGSSSFSSWR